jgi:hypothetical protein
MAAYALTIFTGAFLLFQVQPLLGKYILPWFGGGPGVWTTCLLFFQLVLLAGYAYAHASSKWLKPRGQALLHLALLVAALAFLPIIPSESWKPRGGENPTLQILKLLGVTLGLPYLVLSSTGPLLQQWFSRTHSAASPYRLYALSNVGSLLALVSYPIWFETHFTRRTQALMWGWGLAVYVVGCAICAGKVWKLALRQSDSGAGEAMRNSAIGARRALINRLLWVLLPACASVLLMATTNKMCQDVAVIPFLWVLPLALYLLSFIICFDSPRWYVRFPFMLALIAAMCAICWALFEGTDASIYRQIGIYCGGLFVCCMVCHGELYRLRPPASQLTAFYLSIATGGALGGLFVAILSPLIFHDFYELHLGLLLCGILFLVVCASPPIEPQLADIAVGERPRAARSIWDDWRWAGCALPVLGIAGLDWFAHRTALHHHAFSKTQLAVLEAVLWSILVSLAGLAFYRRAFNTSRHWKLITCGLLLAGVVTLAATLRLQIGDSGGDKIYTSRNFYGVLAVYEHDRKEPKDHHFLLQHGRITHGLQFVDPEESKWPTSYYGAESGIGIAANALGEGARRIGLVGLGTATFAAYGRPGDYLRIYEINPEVQRLATTRFSYVKQCAAKVDIALGDARLSMEREEPQQFDLLALDAFSSDAIPVHLLTKEAFELYQRHLKTNGIIVVHISNHYLDLEPVVSNLAREYGYAQASIDYDENEDEWWLYSSTWVLLTRDHDILDKPAIQRATTGSRRKEKTIPLWTDDFASLFQILK